MLEHVRCRERARDAHLLLPDGGKIRMDVLLPSSARPHPGAGIIRGTKGGVKGDEADAARRKLVRAASAPTASASVNQQSCRNTHARPSACSVVAQVIGTPFGRITPGSKVWHRSVWAMPNPPAKRNMPPFTGPAQNCVRTKSPVCPRRVDGLRLVGADPDRRAHQLRPRGHPVDVGLRKIEIGSPPRSSTPWTASVQQRSRSGTNVASVPPTGLGVNSEELLAR